MRFQEYVDLAISMGAADATAFDIQDIRFDSRTLLKCMFGCPDWGRNHTCPSRPGNPTLAEYREMLTRYPGGVIVHTHDKALSQQISLAVEGAAFRDGDYFAFSMADCSLCAVCAAADNAPCRFPKKARPAFHSVGIDVFATVKALGLPLRTLADPNAEEQNWYSAIFLTGQKNT